jgi:uncharacterized surface protein with fasciclin (FAS1) repeats
MNPRPVSPLRKKYPARAKQAEGWQVGVCGRTRPLPGPAFVSNNIVPETQSQRSTKMNIARNLLALIAFSAVTVFAATHAAKAGHHPTETIVDIAASNGSFNTLVVALKEAGLVDTLSGEGPFTVFAPTDAAFAKIPKADLDALLADKEKLTAVLTYHVVSGKVMAADVKPGMVKTVEGSSLKVTTSNGVMVDNAKVTKTDIVATNGVIHVIDTVVIPN